MPKVEKIIRNFPHYSNLYFRELKLASKLALEGRIHQYQEVRALRAFFKSFDIDCVFDVGANRGQYATMLRRDVGYKGVILSFEPSPDVYGTLEKRSSGDRNWRTYNVALSDIEGSAPFHIMAGDQCSSLNPPVKDLPTLLSEVGHILRTVDVPLKRLDSLFGSLRDELGFQRPYLKLDTQGHDLQVTLGAAHTIGEFLGIQTELAIRSIYDGSTDYRKMIDDLERLGFSPNAFFANNRGHFPLLYEMDGIFINTKLLSD